MEKGRILALESADAYLGMMSMDQVSRVFPHLEIRAQISDLRSLGELLLVAVVLVLVVLVLCLLHCFVFCLCDWQQSFGMPRHVSMFSSLIQ